VLLIFGDAAHDRRSSVGPRAGRRCGDDLAFHMQLVAWACGSRPGDFPACADDAAGERQAASRQETHGDRRCVPAARDKTAEQRVTSRRIVEVERLRIELPGEGLDLLHIDDVCFGYETLADVEVLEIVHGRSSSGHAITFTLIGILCRKVTCSVAAMLA